MSIIICGLSKGEEKQYKCPFCTFESDDIEDFATGMCWSCVYPEDEIKVSFVKAGKDGLNAQTDIV